MKPMKLKMLVAIGLFLMVVLTVVVVVQNTEKAGAKQSQQVPGATNVSYPARQSKVVAYYFHGDFRCATCRKIESLSQSVLSSEFASQLKSGELEWQVINVDSPENAHFIRDYQLVSRSLVVVNYENRKQVEYKNLQDIWRLINDEQAFRNYVKGELQTALRRG
jgi:hypothetical protein